MTETFWEETYHAGLAAVVNPKTKGPLTLGDLPMKSGSTVTATNADLKEVPTHNNAKAGLGDAVYKYIVKIKDLPGSSATAGELSTKAISSTLKPEPPLISKLFRPLSVSLTRKLRHKSR